MKKNLILNLIKNFKNILVWNFEGFQTSSLQNIKDDAMKKLDLTFPKLEIQMMQMRGQQGFLRTDEIIMLKKVLSALNRKMKKLKKL